MNILLTNRCNRNCAYCFARERVALEASRTDSPAFMSPGDYRIALDVAARNHEHGVGILGGEPSLHPEFPALLFEAWQRGLVTKVFTNGSWPFEHIRAIERAAARDGRKLHIVLNVNEPARTPPSEQRGQERLLNHLGQYCSLSFNISHLDFEPLFLADVIDRYRTKRHIRLGLAQPLAELRNEYIDIADYPRVAPTLMQLNRLCDERNVALGFDCGFTRCMFTPEQIGEFVLSGTRFRTECGPVVDVGTDLSVWACFPLSTFTKGLKLTDFGDLKQLMRHFHENLRRLYRTGALEECIGCRQRQRRFCFGGCAAHVYRRLNP